MKQLQRLTEGFIQGIHAITNIYADLCQYVHRSVEQVKESMHLLEKGISPGFETPKQVESFTRQLAQLYDILLTLHFNALGLELAGDVFVHFLDDIKNWPYHKTRYIKQLSLHFNYKAERLSCEKD